MCPGRVRNAYQSGHYDQYSGVSAPSVDSTNNAPNVEMEVMMSKSKLSPEGEVIAAMVAAFQVLINCLEESDSLLPGAFPDALRVYVEMVKRKTGDVSDMTLAVLHDIRMATLD
jgi:hypothetical protein